MFWYILHTACHTLYSFPDTESDTPAVFYLLHQCYLLLPTDPVQVNKRSKECQQFHINFYIYLFLNCISTVSLNHWINIKHTKASNPFVNTKISLISQQNS